MKVIFKNLSTDLSCIVKIKSRDEFEVQTLSEKIVDIEGPELVFYVKYIRDFTFGYQPQPKGTGKLQDKITDIVTEKTINSIGNAVVQIVNTYKISDLKDGAVIEINDRAHYVATSGIHAFFNCFPALLYFGQAECFSGKVEVLSSVCINRPDFISLYKLIYRIINLHGFIFNFVKYKVQIDWQRKVSSNNYLTLTFQKLYALPYNEREYQFKPLKVLGDRFLKFIKGKTPKRVYNKLVTKVKRKLGL